MLGGFVHVHVVAVAVVADVVMLLSLLFILTIFATCIAPSLREGAARNNNRISLAMPILERLQGRETLDCPRTTACFYGRAETPVSHSIDRESSTNAQVYHPCSFTFLTGNEKNPGLIPSSLSSKTLVQF